MIGQTVSHYHILDKLGEGGMGVVYKAQDTKLNRTVALKFLPTNQLATDEEKQRFQQEARAAAQLNHAHIATVYEISEHDGETFIAMEYIDGETLAEKVKKRPLKIKEALKIARQVAEGLHAAHELGIVHRDIKSANIMVTSKGVVKIMDFGLAKMSTASMLTKAGTALGTIFYMSPEQSRGEAVDHRSDIWSLGVVMYEMISGQLPFKGDYEQAVMYSILNAEPEPLTGVRTGVPMDLERIVTKLLAKEADARYQHVDEVPVDLRKIDLEAATGASRISTTRVTVAPDPIPVRRMRPLPIIGLAVAMLVVGFLAAQIMNVGSQQEPVVTRLPVSIPGIKRIEDPAMSPLGDRIAFQGVDSTGRPGLYEYELRPGGQLIYREGSERAARPAYSLDGRWVAAPAWGEILKYRVPQGAPQVLKGNASVFGNLKWLDDETILFTTTDGTISKISANGGESEVVLAPDAASGHASLLLEDFFPDRRRVLISIQSRGEHNAPVALGVGDIEAQTYEILEASACCGKHVDGGHLLYVKTEATGAGTPGMYVVRPFSINSLTFTGPAHDLYEETPGFAVGMGSRKTLLHSPVVTNSNEAILKRHDLTTSEEGVFVRFVQQMSWPDISPDGSLLVKQEDSGSPIDRRLEVYDLVNDRSFTLVEGDSIFHPTWSHDGTDVYFSRYANDAFSIWKKRSNQTGSETLVLAEGSSQELSPDGSWLAFSKGTNWGDPVRGVFLLDLSSGETRVLDSLSIETHYKAFSGDGRYLVHSRIENGRIALVVRSTDGRDEIPLTSGMAPNWDIKRNRIYFLNEAETILYHVDVRTEPNFTKLGEPEVVFRFPFSGANRYVIDSANEVVYSVSLWDIDLNGPDAILNVIQHFDRYAASLVEGSN